MQDDIHGSRAPMAHRDHPCAPDTGLLVEIAAGLAVVGDVGPLLERFLEPIVRLAGAQAGAVRVLSEAGDQLELVSEMGLPAGLCNRERSVARHCGHCGAAADGLELVSATDLSACSARSGATYFGAACQRLLAVPLKHRERVLGVYNLFFSGTAEPAPAVLAVLKAVGELLGLALNNARLEQETLRTTLLHERQAMAAEVHDSLAQYLAFVKMRMPLLRDAICTHDELHALQYCDDVRGAVTQAHSSLRGILTHFRSPMDPRGLLHALGTSVDSFRRSTGTVLEFVNDLPGLHLAAEQETHVFHIVQEALTNVVRHAGAQHARLHIAPLRASEVQVLIEDDGAGLPCTSANTAHYGLEIMRERARRLGGTLEIGARAGGGTCLRLVFALQPAAAGQDVAAAVEGMH